jgi:quercetin dioxygenase-like cupin family protein
MQGPLARELTTIGERDMRWMTGAVGSVVLAVICLTSAPARAQNLDSPVADAAHHKVEFENEYVRVVRYVIAPHDKTAQHNHPNLVNVLLTDLNAKATGTDGKTTELHGKAGSAAWRGPTVHVVENVGDQQIEGILVEPKGPAKAGWTPPAQDAAQVDPAHHKIEIDNEFVRVERYSYEKGEKAPMHAHPANVQISLTDASLRSTGPDGKTTERQSKAGQAVYREPLVHAIENVGGPFSGILVVLKNAK